MNYLIKRFLKQLPVKTLLLIFSLYMFQSCKDNPNDLGFTFIPAVDTTLTRFLDSQADTMAITSNNYKKFINTSSSNSILVGLHQGYESKALLKFSNIGPEFDSTTVTSAILTIRYNDYFFRNEMGQTAFDIFRVNTNFNYETVTFDSVNSSSIGTTSMGNFSGTPLDTHSVNITLNNQLAKDWLEYAADTSYAVKNYGFILQPNMSSNTIKGFYSFNNITELIPYITIIYTKNSVADTIKLVTSKFVTLSNAPASIIPAERFVLQSGVAFRDILNFDLTKLPPNVIINNATLTFTLDNAMSFISPATDKRVVLGIVTDSVNKTDSLTTEVFQLDSTNYSISSTSLNSLVQRWNSGVLPNLGLSLKNFFEIQNLDYFVFYSPSAADITKRPRLKITYTPRN